MRKFEEYNVFVQTGKLIALWRESRRRSRIGFCPRDRVGQHVTSLQLPLRVVTILYMTVALLYLPLWLFAVELDFLDGRVADLLGGLLGYVLAAFALFILILGAFFLRVRYTLTDTELIVRRMRSRRANLRDLKQWSLVVPPRVKPGRKIRLTIEDTNHITLRHLRSMEGGTHFVMLLSEATGLGLIEPFLGVEPPTE